MVLVGSFLLKTAPSILFRGPWRAPLPPQPETRPPRCTTSPQPIAHLFPATSVDPENFRAVRPQSSLVPSSVFLL